MSGGKRNVLKRFERDARTLDGKLGGLLAEIAAKRRELVALLAQTLRQTPPGSIQPAFPVSLRSSFGPKDPLPRELEDILQMWMQQEGTTPLGRAAKRALETRGKT